MIPLLSMMLELLRRLLGHPEDEIIGKESKQGQEHSIHSVETL
jgi:hypothetical protein